MAALIIPIFGLSIYFRNGEKPAKVYRQWPDIRVEIDRRVTAITLPITCAGKVYGKSTCRGYHLARESYTLSNAIRSMCVCACATSIAECHARSSAPMTDSKLASSLPFNVVNICLQNGVTRLEVCHIICTHSANIICN